MKVNEMFDCLVTPLQDATIAKQKGLEWGTQSAGYESFKYIYNKFSKLKGCISSVHIPPTSNEFKGYSNVELIEYYCTPAMLEIIDTIQSKTTSTVRYTHHEGFNATHLQQSLIINASRLDLESDRSVNRLFCKYAENEIFDSVTLLEKGIGYTVSETVFFGFKGENCSRKNVFKFLFDGAIEVIDEVQENLIHSFINPIHSNINLTNYSLTSNTDEENPYAKFINVAIGFAAVVISAGIGYLGYKLYHSRKVEHIEIFEEPIPEFNIENNNEIIAAGITAEEITDNTI